MGHTNGSDCSKHPLVLCPKALCGLLAPHTVPRLHWGFKFFPSVMFTSWNFPAENKCILISNSVTLQYNLYKENKKSKTHSFQNLNQSKWVYFYRSNYKLWRKQIFLQFTLYISSYFNLKRATFLTAPRFMSISLLQPSDGEQDAPWRQGRCRSRVIC